ncbi:MAG TPA: hypothetical protein VF331_05515, partial [Polyangiales bacterium]
MNRARHALGLMLLLTAAGAAGRATAQAAPATSASGRPPAGQPRAAPALGTYFEALRKRRLVQGETAKVEELRKLLAAGERAEQAGRHEDAALLLFELVESPRFADYAGEAEVDGARYMLGTALHELGAEESARRYLRAVLDK